MTPEQWDRLVDVIEGGSMDPLPAAFIIDSPWLPGWAGISVLDYYTSESLWFEANLRAIREFPDVLFLPGFWAEFGMCTEPSAFGARCVWAENEFPFAAKVLRGPEEAASLHRPDPRQDGLLPFVLKRLEHARPRIEQAGHHIRFAVSRGPFNIATFLMGTAEFLTALYTNPEEMHALLATITGFLVDWLRVQKDRFPTIDGIMLLDDPVGFCGPDEFTEFALPCLRQAFSAFDARVRFFHNDASGLVCAPHLAAAGVNLFNFSFEHTFDEIRQRAGETVALLGNLPPRDVLAAGTPEEVRRAVRSMLASARGRSRILFSCGGGMPPNVSTANLRAFLAELGYGESG